MKLNASTIGALINFKISPLDSNDDWRPCIHAICKVLNKMPSQLFTEAQTQLSDAKAKVTEVSEAEAFFAMESLEEQSPQARIEQKELRHALDNALGVLNQRQQEVLRLHYGLDAAEMTYREIAAKLGLSTGRIIQIHDRAIRILRHPHRGIVKNMKFLASA